MPQLSESESSHSWRQGPSVGLRVIVVEAAAPPVHELPPPVEQVAPEERSLDRVRVQDDHHRSPYRQDLVRRDSSGETARRTVPVAGRPADTARRYSRSPEKSVPFVNQIRCASALAMSLPDRTCNVAVLIVHGPVDNPHDRIDLFVGTAREPVCAATDQGNCVILLGVLPA